MQREQGEHTPLGKSGQRSLLLISRRIGYEFYLQSLSNSKSAKKSPVKPILWTNSASDDLYLTAKIETPNTTKSIS
jgi:hypothetical protein